MKGAVASGPWPVASIVGVGLIGGSFAMALRKTGFAGRIVGVSSEGTIRRAMELGVIDEGAPLEEAAGRADLVYLAQPISRILETLDTIDDVVRRGTLITDAGSTKSAILARARQRIRRGRFVGGHPMAGKESRGVEAAEAELFRGRPYVLTEHDATLVECIERMGALPVIFDAEEHDRLVAFTSHLPQLISTALAATLGAVDGAAGIAGPAALDLTRLALSPYDIWRDIFSTNARAIDQALAAFLARLEALRGPGIEEAFDRAADAARTLRRAHL